MTNDAVSLQALQAALPPGTWVLSLLLGSEHTVALLVGHNAVHGQCLPMGSRGLQEQVTALHTQMRAFAPAESGLQALADVLLKPWQASGVLQRAHTLIVLPHGPLVRLPFGALPLDGVPLWQDHTLSLALTAGQLIDSLALPPPEPVQTVTALAPHRDLAFARLEALAVADTAWLGSQASRARLQECTTDALDIAAHAELDSSDPLGSAVLLAPNAATSDSGRLELRQVFGLQKLPPLVTLSACDSAAPTSGGGEWLGLGQAFLVAGARTVVASQNRVSDLATALLMKHFYRLVRHAPRAQALQQAAMTVRATFPHPAHWANFMLLGDPR